MPINTSLHVLLWLYCQDLAMILTSVPCIMICHDLGEDTMVNHDLARFTMIMARVPWLRTLGIEAQLFLNIRQNEAQKVFMFLNFRQFEARGVLNS